MHYESTILIQVPALFWVSFSWVYISIYILHQCCIQALVCCLVHTRSCTYSSNWASTKFMTILDDNSSSRCETFVYPGQQLILGTVLTWYCAVTTAKTELQFTFSSPLKRTVYEFQTTARICLQNYWNWWLRTNEGKAPIQGWVSAAEIVFLLTLFK